MTAPGRLRVAGIFLLAALPPMAVLDWVQTGALSDSKLTVVLLLTIPALAAAMAGIWWRNRLPAYPDWRTRRPYSRLMGLLLLPAGYAVSLLIVWVRLQSDHFGAEGALMLFSDVKDLLLQPRMLATILPALIFELLICLIQTEIGLFLGVWITERVSRCREG